MYFTLAKCYEGIKRLIKEGGQQLKSFSANDDFAFRTPKVTYLILNEVINNYARNQILSKWEETGSNEYPSTKLTRLLGMKITRDDDCLVLTDNTSRKVRLTKDSSSTNTTIYLPLVALKLNDFYQAASRLSSGTTR